MTHPDPWGAQSRDVSGPSAKHRIPLQYDEVYLHPTAPIDGDRFRPKARLRDPIFLVLFILQVLSLFISHARAHDRHALP